MVGMSGRSRESRTTSAGPHSAKKSTNQRTPQKPRLPAEALQMARILEDTRQSSEMDDKVKKICELVPFTEEEVHLALHDNDFDVEKATIALLDRGQVDTGEWTTTSNRKSKKKESHTSGGEGGHSTTAERHKTNNPGRTSHRSAKEGYGGSVNVSSGRGRSQNNRGKNQSTMSSKRPRPSGGEQRKGRVRTRGGPKSQTQDHDKDTEQWDVFPSRVSQSEVNNDWEPTEHQWKYTTFNEDKFEESYWESTELQLNHNEVLHQDFETSDQSSVFPEALPSGLVSVVGNAHQVMEVATRSEITPVTTRSEITPALLNTSSGDSRQHTPTDIKEKVSRKPKRLARSQIPTKPVEMPDGIDSLDVQFGQLGIDFVGLDSPSKELESEASSFEDIQQRLVDTSGSDELLSQSNRREENDASLLLDPSSSYKSTDSLIETQPSTESVPSSIRGPPGLSHPSSTSDRQESKTEPAKQQPQQSIETNARLQDVNLKSPTAIELPRHSTTPVEPVHTFTSIVTTSSDELMLSSTTQSVIPSVNNLTSVASTRPSSTTMSTQQQHSQSKQSSSGTTVPPGMQLYHHMNMIPHHQYPFIPAVYNYDPNDMSRYPGSSMAYFSAATDPSITAGPHATRDHTSSSFTTQDQSKFPRTANDLSTSSTAHVSSAQNQQNTNLQHQQMGPTFVGAPFYHNLFYPTMYGPMPAFSQGANFGMSTYEDMAAAVVTGGHTAPSLDYSKMYGTSMMNKPSSIPSCSAGTGITTDSSSGVASSFKQFESSKPFSYNVPTPAGNVPATGNIGGTQTPGYYMQIPPLSVPTAPMMLGHGGGGGAHDVSGATQHSRLPQQKHNKVGSYQGNSNASFWASATHSS